MVATQPRISKQSGPFDPEPPSLTLSCPATGLLLFPLLAGREFGTHLRQIPIHLHLQ